MSHRHSKKANSIFAWEIINSHGTVSRWEGDNDLLEPCNRSEHMTLEPQSKPEGQATRLQDVIRVNLHECFALVAVGIVKRV